MGASDELADKRLPITETTKAAIDEVKDPKESYDLWIRRNALDYEV